MWTFSYTYKSRRRCPVQKWHRHQCHCDDPFQAATHATHKLQVKIFTKKKNVWQRFLEINCVRKVPTWEPKNKSYLPRTLILHCNHPKEPKLKWKKKENKMPKKENNVIGYILRPFKVMVQLLDEPSEKGRSGPGVIIGFWRPYHQQTIGRQHDHLILKAYIYI